jgi:hypothetical protein
MITQRDGERYLDSLVSVTFTQLKAFEDAYWANELGANDPEIAEYLTAKQKIANTAWVAAKRSLALVRR